MIILVVNCGSSSLKYQVLDMTDESVLCKGNAEKIGLEDSFIGHKKDGKSWNVKVFNKTPSRTSSRSCLTPRWELSRARMRSVP